jgi:hypothetical protein
VIVGREIIKVFGFLLYFKDETIYWDGAITPMVPENADVEERFLIADSF